MSRNEEYFALLSQLEQAPLPPALTDSVPRARIRARRQSRRRSWQASLASLGGAAAAFVLAVNLSAPFALACRKVPILKELAAAVATSPSMKAAIAHDYIQYVGQSQTENGVTVTLEYLILDRSQLNIFCTVTGPETYDSYFLNPILAAPDGTPLAGYGVGGTAFAPGELAGFSSTLDPDVPLPEELLFTARVTAMERTSDTPAIPLDVPAAAHYDVEPRVIATLTFPLTVDKSRIGPGQQMDIGQWVELDGERLQICSLAIDATQARLTVVSDPNNSSWCEGLSFYLEDAKGKSYKAGAWATSDSSYLSRGEDREAGQVDYYLESPYFEGTAPYTLHITGAHWLDKAEDKRLVQVDLTTGAVTGLPEGVTPEPDCGKIDGTGQIRLAFRVPDELGNLTLFSWTYYDGSGQAHRFSSGWHRSQEEKDYHTEGFYLFDYPHDTVALELSHTWSTRLETPLTVTFGQSEK